MNKIKIAIVEDDASILRLLEINLQAQGYHTQTYTDPLIFLEETNNQVPDLLILDIMLPGIDGLELCHRLRQNSATKALPILMLTARGEEIDRVLGLEIGADDYMTKPFSIRELIARIKALLRRSKLVQDTPTPVLIWGPLSLDTHTHQAFCADKSLPLSSKEYELLHALMVHPGWVVTREILLEQIWGYNFTGETRTVDMHIANLRRKLEQYGGKANWIETLRGVGYRLANDTSKASQEENP